MIPTSQAFNNKVLIHFNKQVYGNVLTEDNIVGNEVGVQVKNQKVAGYILKKDRVQYFLTTPHISSLPIKVLKSQEVFHNQVVLHLITKMNTIKIPKNDSLSFRNLINGLCNFQHTNPEEYTLAKIVMVAAYVSQVNFRLAASIGFGKDSIIEALSTLTNNCVKINKATFPKLEYVLRYPLIICNEIASQTDSEKQEFECFGEAVGDFHNTYTKRSRKYKGSKESFDIHKLSLGFTYNHADSYHDIGRKSFDDSFRGALLDRFLPLRMSGQILVGQFKSDGELDYKEEALKNLEFYKGVVSKLMYLIEHPLKVRYKHSYNFGKKGRHKKSFDTIALFLGEYCLTEGEFNIYIDTLYSCYLNYFDKELEHDLVVKKEVVK